MAIIDICFVSFKLETTGPKNNISVADNSPLTKSADKLVDKAVTSFAKLVGWEGPKDGSHKLSSAIDFLERKT